MATKVISIDLFAKAKKESVSKKAEKHEILTISAKFEKNLERMAEIDEKMAEMEAERALLDGDVREAAKTGMIDLYNQKNSFPGTLKVEAGSRSFLFITSDKYIKIDEEGANNLTKKYGDDVVTEKTLFTLNPAMVEKYAPVLSDLIMNSKKIADADKVKIIENTTSWTVAKGTIEKLRSINFAKFNLTQIIEDIRPIFSVKANKE
jgi:hypothetical protein